LKLSLAPFKSNKQSYKEFFMRKYLLSTSTLAGAALLSSVAVADVSICG
jgi:hypothetical protein